MTLQDLILKLSDYWATQGCLIQQPLDIELGAGTMHPETFLRVLGPQPWNVAYVQPVATAGRRAVRREPEPAVQAPPVPGHPQAGARRRAGPLPAEPRGLRHRPARARRAVRGGQLGIADARRLGHRLAGALRRAGDHAVHLLPAGGRPGSLADLGRAHLRARAIRDGAPGRGQRLRPAVGAGRDVSRRALPRRSGAVEVRVRRAISTARSSRSSTATCSTKCYDFAQGSARREAACCRRSTTA